MFEKFKYYDARIPTGSPVTPAQAIAKSVTLELGLEVRTVLNFEDSWLTKFCYWLRHYKTHFSSKIKFKSVNENKISKNTKTQENLKSHKIPKSPQNTLATKDLAHAKDPKANSIKSPKIEKRKIPKTTQK